MPTASKTGGKVAKRRRPAAQKARRRHRRARQARLLGDAAQPRRRGGLADGRPDPRPPGLPGTGQLPAAGLPLGG